MIMHTLYEASGSTGSIIIRGTMSQEQFNELFRDVKLAELGDTTTMNENEKTPKLSPSEARRSAGLSQNALSRATELSVNAIQNAESKRRLFYTTAVKIVDAINPLRVDRGLAPLQLEDIDWIIR